MAYDLMIDNALRAEIEKLIDNDSDVLDAVFGDLTDEVLTHEVDITHFIVSRMSRSAMLKLLKGNNYTLPLAKNVERIKREKRLRQEEEQRKEKQFAEAEPLRQKCIVELEDLNVKIRDLRESLNKAERAKRDIQNQMFMTPHDHKWSHGICILCNDAHPDYRSRMSF